VTENIKPEDVMSSMNATRVLISILETIKHVDVPTDTFVNLDMENRELNIDYNGDTQSFRFQLKEKVNSEQQSDSN
jgi:hypothetical protein